MDHAPHEERNLLKHPIEAVLAVLLLVSLLFVVQDNEPTRTAAAERSCAVVTATGCTAQP